VSEPEPKGEKAKKELDVMFSKLNALEASATDNFQKSLVQVLRMLVETQMHSINEFDHFKKALDLLMLQLFKIENKTNSSL